MGMITVITNGSFKKIHESFTTQTHGHAHAIAELIKYLAEEVLPEAINQDHRLRNEDAYPEHTFEKKY